MAMELGYTMMTEQSGPRDLVGHVVGAEEADFDFAVSSDHYFPWLEEMGHSPNAWVILGAAAQATSRIDLMTYVTCPILRYHPAVVAQKAATLQLLSEGRFSLGLGAGENLNEHVVGKGWPPVDVRHEMLTEAVEVIRSLWSGGFTNHRGRHYTVESAKLYDLPDPLPPIGIAGSGKQSTALAAVEGDYLIATEPKAEIVQAYRDAGGSGDVVGQFPVCFGEEHKSLQLLHEQFRWMGLGWKVNSELPGTAAFDSASQFVREEDMSQTAAWGTDVARYQEKVQAFADAGFTKVALVQVGPEQKEFCDWYASDLKQVLTAS